MLLGLVFIVIGIKVHLWRVTGVKLMDGAHGHWFKRFLAGEVLDLY